MMFSRACAVHAGHSPLWRLQVWAIERLASGLSQSSDLRWAIATLAIAALATLEAIIARQLASRARNTMRRAFRGARLAAGLTAADSMVAAGSGPIPTFALYRGGHFCECWNQRTTTKIMIVVELLDLTFALRARGLLGSERQIRSTTR